MPVFFVPSELADVGAPIATEPDWPLSWLGLHGRCPGLVANCDRWAVDPDSRRVVLVCPTGLQVPPLYGASLASARDFQPRSFCSPHNGEYNVRHPSLLATPSRASSLVRSMPAPALLSLPCACAPAIWA